MYWTRIFGVATAYVTAFLFPSVATVLMVVVTHYVTIPNISLLYLPVILLVAIYYGTLPSLLTAATATAEYDFFLLRPLYTWNIGQAQDILAFVVFLGVAIITSQLAVGARARTEAAQSRARESAMLYDLAQALMSFHSASEVLKSMTNHVVQVFGLDRCAVFVPSDRGRLELSAENIRGARDRASEAAAGYAYTSATQVALPLEGEFTGDRLYIPLRVGEQVLGVMEVGRKRAGGNLDSDERRVLTLFAAHAALALDRAKNEEERTRLGVIEESDRLKSALLSAVSHELRTPLASIKASATGLLLPGATWTDDESEELLHMISVEADRLNRLVGNLLDLSRIEAGVLKPVLDWYDADELAQAIEDRVQAIVANRPFSIDVDARLGPVRLDLQRAEALAVNLIENAAKYTPPDSPIEVALCRLDDTLSLSVSDHGAGIPAAQRARVFQTFYRGGRHSDRSPGTGLGLAICRGIAEAHGGHIEVTDTSGGGATFTVFLPGAATESAVPQ